MTDFIDALRFRHACKQFDAEKKISAEQFEQILEFGRLSPSSFGQEHWRFVVVETPELRQSLREVCWNQAQIVDASHVVVILAKTTDVEPFAEYQKSNIARRHLPAEMIERYLELYDSHYKAEIQPVMSTYAWSSKQCYIALANMLTGAATLGIDSCPIEGFSKKGVEEVLEVDTSRYEVAVVAAFGYRAGEQTPQLRHSIDELVEYR